MPLTPSFGRGFKDVRAHCYCPRKLTRHVKHRARVKQKWTMIGKMAIATALCGLYDLGHSVTPTFLSRNRFYLQWSTRCLKMNKNWAWEVKKISRFLFMGHRIHSIHPSIESIHRIHLSTARCEKLWSLNSNLFFKEPHQLTKFT